MNRVCLLVKQVWDDGAFDLMFYIITRIILNNYLNDTFIVILQKAYLHLNRQTFIKRFGIGSSIAILSPSLFTSCKTDEYELFFFTQDQYSLVDELSEVILPRSEQSPGAKDAKVAQFMDSLVFHCYTKKRQVELITDIGTIENQSVERYTQSFHSLDQHDKIGLVSQFETHADESYFRIKALIVFSYFTSEKGVTEALRYVAVPGSYEGHIDYELGDKAWAL